jgi:uncharacterized membrane protein
MSPIVKTSKNQPNIKISRTTIDWVLEFVALAFLLILISLPLIFSGNLPEKIPVHFNLAGEPDGYGTRFTLWLLPLTGFIIYMGMTILESFPHIYNYPVEITPENIVTQYRFATRLIRVLKTGMLILFAFLSYKTIKTALGSTPGLGKAFLPVTLILTFGIVIIYFVRSLNSRHGD